MLGEDHSLLNEFPNHKEKIISLNTSDKSFAVDAKSYHQLDTEIRKLELKNAPIEDDPLHQMKLDRASLKDSLYQRLIAAR
ncbi:hypothetical protein GCM10007916_33810 [Psychromonas marina]|uniref:DUF465 domain-containing protein n=1 Tax=Psychromonas marina TaxID=88364 RepID=A0ABQ6E5N9_9GAMM|nr:YdcH family protein [Psychromonas marina]GLS92311.1 hypothetical protein GCM10007916_33810 [Psychromonas marina]